MNPLLLARSAAPARSAVATLAVLAGAVGLVVAGPAPAHASSYGVPYDTIAGVSARVAPADRSDPRTYVEALRDRDAPSGGTQVSMSWKRPGHALRTTSVRKLTDGATTTFRTSPIACDEAVTVTLNVRYRASASSAWEGWRHYGVSYVRDC